MIQTVLIAGLAGARLTRAWLHETIGKPLRKPIEDWSAKTEHPDGEWVILDPPILSATKRYVHELVGCPHCMGFWLTLGCVIAYRWRATRPLVVALAGATITSAFADHYPGFDLEDADAD